MVPRCSDKIARVSSYSLSLTGLWFRLQGYHLLWPDFPDCSTTTHPFLTTGLFPFRSPLLRESRLISFPPVTEMFQFTGFAPHTYLFSVRYLLRGGFPHSEIAGSKLVCQLADTYRRLPRPSSPSTAKASTMCAYSLDHITPRSLGLYVSIDSHESNGAGFSHCERDIFKLDTNYKTINNQNA
jgi:hypothetical protein